MVTERGPVFIAGHTKAGTTLLQALLDGHPELFVIPVETKFFKFPSLPSLPPGNMPPPPLSEVKTPIPRKKVSIEQIKEEILSHSDLADLLDGREISRNIEIKGKDFSIRKFKEIVNGTNESTLKDLYETIFRAFFLSTNDDRNINKIMFAEKTPNLEEYAEELESWFPDARFIHIVRNPYANIYSLRKAGWRTPPLRDTYRAMAKSHYFLERNRRYVSKYKYVRFEDMVMQTEKIVQDICEFLGIDYVDSLRKPTILGHPWGGNSRTAQGDFQGIDPRPVNAFKGNISSLDIALVNRFFSYFMKKYEYKIITSQKVKRWIPSGIELPYSYVSNRKLLLGSSL